MILRVSRLKIQRKFFMPNLYTIYLSVFSNITKTQDNYLVYIKLNKVMEEIADLEGEATTIMADVSARLAKAKKPLAFDTQTYLQNRIERVLKVIKAMRIEIRELPKEKQAQPTLNAAKLDEKVQKLYKEVNSCCVNPSGNNIITFFFIFCPIHVI